MSDTTKPGATMAPNAERMEIVDTLRAIALFGVILMNLTAMVMMFNAQAVMQSAGPVDMGVGLADLVFLMGKARSSFAFLFGLSFGILMQRAEARGGGFGGFYFRRVAILLVIGVLNLAFLYWGDILIIYALLGMALMLFRGLSQKALLTVGLALVIAPPLVAGLIQGVTGAPLPNLAGLSAEQVNAQFTALAPAYTEGGYLDFVRANLTYYGLHNMGDTSYALIYDIGVLGLFMLGLWTARRGVFASIEANRPLLRRVAWVCLPLGLVISGVNALRPLGVPNEGIIGGLMTAAYVGLPVLAFGYLAILTLYISRGGGGLNRLLAPVGRMALTAYLASNAIGSFIWYSWGLGRINDPAWTQMALMNLLSLAVFVALTIFAHLWLRAFRFGPAEWVWRSLTYGRLQPMAPRP